MWLCAYVHRPAGVSTVVECETKGERSLTDGGIGPMTQFMEEGCTGGGGCRTEEGKALMFSVGHVLNTCSP